jgi:hypothetical protein
MIRTASIQLFFSDGATFDATGLVREGSLVINRQLFNEQKTSCVDSASFAVKHDAALADKIKAENKRIGVHIQESGKRIFTGVIEPTFSQAVTAYIGDISFEAADATWKLDEKATEDLVYENYAACDPADASHSLFHLLMAKAGYSPQEIEQTVVISKTVRCFHVAKGTATWRSALDTLLSEYLYTLHADENGVTLLFPWTGNGGGASVEVAGNKSAVKEFQWKKTANYYDGVAVEWSRTTLIQDALLFRDAPSVSSKGEFAGVAIAPGDYYPKDSDIHEVWQSYSSQWLDIPYNARETRLKNEDLSLLNTTNPILLYDADEGIVVDNEDFESHRARIIFKNTGGETKYLRLFEIHGDALIRSNSVNITAPPGAAEPKTYASVCLFDDESANKFADALAADALYSDFQFAFGLNTVEPLGALAHISDDCGVDTLAIIFQREERANDPVVSYTAVAVRDYNAFPKTIIENAASLGQDAVNKELNDQLQELQNLVSIPGTPGPPGASATVYQLIPGATAIKRFNTGVVDPPTISCAQQSITGNDPPVPSNKTLKYITEQAGAETLYEGPVTVGAWDFIEFRLYDDNGVLLDRENVPVLSDGPPATVYPLMPSVPMIIRDPSGVASPSAISCAQQVVVGGKPPEASNKTLTYITSASSVETPYTDPVPVAWEWIEFRLRDGKALLDQERVFVLSEGEPARTYEVQPGASVVRVHDGAADPYKIACAQVSITGNGLPVPSDKTLRYATSLDDEQDYEGELTINPAWGWIEFRLYDDDILLDKERVPVLADGASLLYLDLANQNITVRADEYGNPYGLPLTTQATLYNGNTPITNAAFRAKVAEKNIVYYPGDIFDPMLDGFYPVSFTQWSISRGSIDQNGVITITELPEDQAEITVRAFYDDVEYAATLTLIKVRDGESPAIIDIENENASIACDSYGTPLPGALPLVTKAIFYKGTKLAAPFWSLNTPIGGISIAQDGTITVAKNAALEQTNNIPVLAACWGKTFSRTLTITKALEGFSATAYELLPSARVIRRDAAGNNMPATLSCAQQVVVGNSEPEPAGKTLVYVTSASSAETPYTGPVAVGTLSWIEFRLYIGNTILDQERVPVISNGADSIALDLENENTTVRCDAYGVPYPDSLPITVRAFLYDGWDEAAPAWSLESPPTGVSISSSGIITVAKNAALGYINNIRVNAQYKGVVYSHIFTLGKTLDGESPVFLNIMPDTEVIQCNHRGNPMRGLPLTAQARLTKGSQEITAAMELAEAAKVEILHYPGDIFDPMLGDFYPTLGYPIVWTLAGAPAGVTIDQRGLITVSGGALLNDVNAIRVRAAYHGKTYEAIFGITKAREGTPGPEGDAAKTPQYRGATNIADTGNTGKVKLVSGETVTMNDLDWVLFMGTADWTKARLYQWSAGARVWKVMDPAQNTSHYMDVLETITEDAADGIFSAVFCRVLFAQSAAIERLQSQIIRLHGENGITLDGAAGTIQSSNYKYAEQSGMNTERSGFKLQNGYLSFVGDRINSWFIRSLKGYMPIPGTGGAYAYTAYMRGGIRGMAQFWHENGVLTTGVRSHEPDGGLGFSGEISRIATGVYKITYVCEDSEEVIALAYARIFGYYVRTTKTITGSDGNAYTIPAEWGTIISTGSGIVSDNTNLTITYVFVCKDNNSDSLEEDPAFVGYIYLIG